MNRRSGERQEHNPTTQPRVLIVDDERKNRDLLEVLLSQQGYEIATANNGEDALALVGESLPDIILLDVMMPGMDGYQVAAKLKADPRTMHIPVVMLSALTDRNSMMHGLTAGAAAYLGKPVDAAELRLQVRNLLRLTGED
jgi:DNA-binding response OmpR family regulator